MFQINDDLSINITRGDTAVFTINAIDESGEKHLFQNGDVLRIKVTEKKACENVMFQKDFVVEEETEQVEILLTEDETKIGEVISKPTDYWYEVELNPLTNPQTIIGYDEDGAKIFKLFPEGKDVEPVEPTPEDIPVVDTELDLTSERPVQNQAIARAFLNIQNEIERIDNDTNITSEDLEPLVVGIEENKSNIAKNKGNIEDLSDNVENLSNTLDTHKADTSNPHDVTADQVSIDGHSANNVQGAIDDVSRTLGYTASKNLLKYPYANANTTMNGVTWVDSGQGLLSVSGTATTENSWFYCRQKDTSPLTLKKGTYILSGCPAGGGNTKYQIYIVESATSNKIAIDNGNGCTFTLTEQTNVGVTCIIYSLQQVNNLVFKPMIRLASIEDDTYEPYAPDVNTKLQHYDYLDITDKISKSTNCHSLISAYVKNGFVHIKGVINESAVLGQNTWLFGINDAKYRPSETMYGNIIYRSSADLNKALDVRIESSGTCYVWLLNDLAAHTYFTLMYPI